MKNMIHNELIARCASVDICIVYSSEKSSDGKLKRTAREIDFIASKGGQKFYIQSAMQW